MALLEELGLWWLLRPWYSDENFLRGVNCPLFIPQHGLGFPHPLWRSTLPGGQVHLWQISDNWDWHGASEQPIIQSSLLFVFRRFVFAFLFVVGQYWENIWFDAFKQCSQGATLPLTSFSLVGHFFMLMMVMSGADGGGGHFITINFQASGRRYWHTGHWFSASHQQRRTTLLSSGTFLLIQPDVWSWAER